MAPSSHIKPIGPPDRPLVVIGRFPRILRLQSEIFDALPDPEALLSEIRTVTRQADIFTFLARIGEKKSSYPYRCEAENLAVLRIDSYENWWLRQINDKTRNMIRKAAKKGVALRVVQFDDDFARGIKAIHDESPLRQGKPFKPYGKDLDTVKRDQSSFLDRSDFIGAYLGEELVGYLKLVHNGESASIMQIIAKVSHRDKAPTNALLAKAVEICAGKGIAHLHYGIWGRRTLRDFKVHHDFQCYALPRYYAPLNSRGSVLLKLNFHRKIIDRIPGKFLDVLLDLRGKLNAFRYRSKALKTMGL